jgi:hypothetical protein
MHPNGMLIQPGHYGSIQAVRFKYDKLWPTDAADAMKNLKQRGMKLGDLPVSLDTLHWEKLHVDVAAYYHTHQLCADKKGGFAYYIWVRPRVYELRFAIPVDPTEPYELFHDDINNEFFYTHAAGSPAAKPVSKKKKQVKP